MSAKESMDTLTLFSINNKKKEKRKDYSLKIWVLSTVENSDVGSLLVT